MKRLALVDGNALLHRAYHATPPLTTSKGELVNAVYGFTSMLLRSIDELKPDFIAVAWDEKGPTFRHQAYTQYKATRGPKDDGLSSQYPRVFQVVDTLNIPEFSLSGYEADDLIGTLAKQATQNEKNLEVIIVTGDRDIMQIIDKNIKILMPKKTLADVGLYGVEEFVVRYGFLPKNLVDYKALCGDASDNIPGVAGIGDVSATKLVQEFGAIEKVYKSENLKTLPERMQKLLAEGAEDAAMSKNLATLELNAPIQLDLTACRVHDYNHKQAVKLFEELEFRSLIKRLPGEKLDVRSEKIDEEVRGLKFDSLTSNFQSQYPSSNSQHPSSTTDLDLAVQPVLEKMSKAGIMVDLKLLDKMGKQLKKRLESIEQDIYSKIGHEFNLNSPKQLSQVLFDELKLPVIRRTKTGRSTDEATLRELAVVHPVIPQILEYRQLFKLISTYIDALPKYANKNSRIHSTFNVEGAATGRLSSQDPNLQNIPVRGQLGGEIRKAFVAPKGKVLLKADYSQVELRILAHLSDDSALKEIFKKDLDIHAATAAKIFNIPLDQVSLQQRNVGKTMNFATLYGQGAHALASQLRIDFQTARQYIQEYFAQFPKVREWMIKVLEEGYEKGYVQTLWGRKRYIPELQATNRMLKAAGERAAVNHPVQGTQADMIKKAMVEIDKEIQNCCMILQVHDELLFECDPKSVEETARMVKDKMENALILSVPVVVDLKVGKNWGEMELVDVSKQMPASD
ncbi:hypothetical protein A3C26_00045 [Candidatus Daviesbacteria bacterium RIFCSPHIGHO2_02_FULL_39_12]|uniref:DNA-directed DNA polymerase n=2 Tax=Candidatus Daviesiibacteriota TaxID=1752718 RepID=A0A1F5JBT4_9BACT|nr:MAG: hypothetical protein A3C26_00045 [Candidatus Daviesbacteria bacterium RIFCSPHIGHO2_02_FULL_39_12]OGE71351.1 MAG: hypothetical protein A3H40_03595 [Candidatus Daviesbacteria bacterium RIFCSPLOWO2_02_FULL_38_15]